MPSAESYRRTEHTREGGTHDLRPKQKRPKSQQPVTGQEKAAGESEEGSDADET